MPKRIYVAAPWSDRKEAQNTALTLASYGYVITQAWWNFEAKEQDFEEGSVEHADFLRFCGELDVRGVRTADAVVLLNSSKSEGKAVEQGLAIAYGIPIIAIGKLGQHSQNVFHHLPSYYWVSDIYEAVQKLTEVLGG